MTAFDTDVLSDVAKAVPAVIAQLAAVPISDQFVPVVAAEEALRGQFATVRAARAGRGVGAVSAYSYLAELLTCLRGFRVLTYTPVAHSLFLAWKAAKIKIGSQDLRIAAICIAHGATLVTRNARDYALVPGLALDVWN